MQDLAGRGPLALAVSGGADSVAMLRLVAEWCARHARPAPAAVTVDHGLRQEAADEARRVAAWARDLGIAHATLTLSGASIASNVQAQAREARYRLIGNWMRQSGHTVLLTGHTLDDQAETFFIRLARGSGLEGLTGMSRLGAFPLPGFDELEIARPLLGVSHEALVTALRARGQPWIEDPSNANERFKRARLRALRPALDELGLTAARIADTMDHLRRANDIIRAEVQALAACAVAYEPWGYALLSHDPLAAAPAEVALRVLSRVLQDAGGGTYPPEFAQTSEVLDWIVRADGPRGRTVGGCRLQRRDSGDILAAREEEVLLSVAPAVPITAGETILWDRRFQVALPEDAGAGPFEVRALGLEGLKQVEGKATMPPIEPNRIGRTLPAIWKGDQLQSAPLLGFHGQVRAVARFLGGTRPWNVPISAKGM